jgi:hypothetical protein
MKTEAEKTFGSLKIPEIQTDEELRREVRKRILARLEGDPAQQTDCWPMVVCTAEIVVALDGLGHNLGVLASDQELYMDALINALRGRKGGDA